jgi:hypothetical protein
MGKMITPFDTGIRLQDLELVDTTYNDVTVWLTKYFNDAPALLLTIEEPGGRENLAIVSSNLGTLPAEGCIWVKDYSENAGVLAQLQSQGLLETTGVTQPSGWVVLPEARFIGDLAVAFERFKEVAY